MERTHTRKEKEIWHACDTLWEKGVTIEKITGEAIAETLVTLGYKRGSRTDLHHHRKSWIAFKNKVLANTPVSPVDPATVTDRITQAAVHLRQEVYAQVQEEIHTLQTEAQQAVTAANEACAIKEAAYNALLEEKERLANTLALLEQKHATLIEQYNKMQSEYPVVLEREKMCTQAMTAQIALMEKNHQDMLATLRTHWEKKEADYQLGLSDYKNLVENQRHQWIKHQDELTTENKRLQSLYQKEKACNQDYKNKLENITSREKEVKIAHRQLSQKYHTVQESLIKTKTTLEIFKAQTLQQTKRIRPSKPRVKKGEMS